MLTKQVYWPFTPGGSALAHLESRTEAAAWKKLLKDAAHMPYKTIENFKKRGYTVEKIESNIKKSKGNTRVHCVDDDNWQIWLDTDIGVRDGLCLASSSNFNKAKKEAIEELKKAIISLEKRTKQNAN